jgi:hypothetical protein
MSNKIEAVDFIVIFIFSESVTSVWCLPLSRAAIFCFLEAQFSQYSRIFLANCYPSFMKAAGDISSHAGAGWVHSPPAGGARWMS